MTTDELIILTNAIENDVRQGLASRQEPELFLNKARALGFEIDSQEETMLRQFKYKGKTMKILYLHGFGSSGQSSTVKFLKKQLPDYYEVTAPDIPVDPAEALPFLKKMCHDTTFDIVIGTSMGGMYAQQLQSCRYRICVNPALHMSQQSKVLKIGTFEFFQARTDGQTHFTITEEIKQHFRDMEDHQFDGYRADNPENLHCYGLFGTHDTTVNCRDEFARYYTNVQTFEGEHRMNKAVLKNVILPIVLQIEKEMKEVKI